MMPVDYPFFFNESEIQNNLRDGELFRAIATFLF